MKAGQSISYFLIVALEKHFFWYTEHIIYGLAFLKKPTSDLLIEVVQKRYNYKE